MSDAESEAQPAVEAVIFDAYGTLLDVHAAMAGEAARIGPDWARISIEWRHKQLEYSWVRSLTGPGSHQDFWRCTQDALDYIAARYGLKDPALLNDLLTAYRRSPAYPEVPAVLRALRGAGLATAILSNGEPYMLAEACDAAGITGLLDDVLSIESVGVFKPHPHAYRLAERRFGIPAERMAFVSANAWDAQGALEYGFRVFRVNRNREPDEYALADRTATLRSLQPLPERLR
ncbi:haloacid dehalogenase type II [Roseomonas sp. NAR14]|uniref:(S)-2-haloacid dehalogenase n=1 Tax=Roseomonas acroporae TaxID=2937791 RepID=A0A9X1YDR5_9PROT|nr:haloacid dehalogenase type II [Roseomonas acroporae]